MKRYQASLQRHLGTYARKRLGVDAKGIYKGCEYAHILPRPLRYLNFLEGCRAELQAYLEANPAIKLHEYFHHLNSSQAFALNLFYPYFAAGGSASRALGRALGVDADVKDWVFEKVPDEEEGTNVDVAWVTRAGVQVYCEVKLSESEFGSAEINVRRQRKLARIYRPRLESVVTENLLNEKVFFRNYQLLRNISLLSSGDQTRLVLLVPRENESLTEPLRKVLSGVAREVRKRIMVSYVEDCLRRLQKDQELPADLRSHAVRLQEKYVPA